MKNHKVDDKSKFLYAVILSVLLVGLCIIFGYKKLEDKARTLNTENSNLETRIASLKMYYDAEEQNIKDTEAMTAEISEIFKAYPGDARFEDGIYEAYYLYGASANTMDFEKVAFTLQSPVKEIPVETVLASEIEGFEEPIRFNQFDVAYDGKVTYEGLKGMIEQINGDDYFLAIGKMNYKITEEGLIEGTTLLSFYSVEGAGCDYTQPPVVPYETGLSNLFGVSGDYNSGNDETATED